MIIVECGQQLTTRTIHDCSKTVMWSTTVQSQSTSFS